MHFFRTCAFKGIIAKGASVQGTFPPEILVGERVNIEVVHAVITPVHELVYNLYPFTYSGVEKCQIQLWILEHQACVRSQTKHLKDIVEQHFTGLQKASTRNSAREERSWKGSE